MGIYSNYYSTEVQGHIVQALASVPVVGSGCTPRGEWTAALKRVERPLITRHLQAEVSLVIRW